MTTVIPVLLYHSVRDRPAPSDAWGTVSSAEFRSHVSAIAASGREALTITQLADALRSVRPLPDRSVAVTFDDGFADTLAAVELLRESGIGSTVYATSAELGTHGRLSPAQINDLAALPGVELGSHAVRHRRLDELDGPTLAEEVGASKLQLEELAQQPVVSFAYPHGSYDRRARDAVIAAGYRSAAAVKNAVSHPRDDPFAIARWTVTGGTSAGRLARVLEGESVPVAWAGERLRTRAYRAARRRRRRLLDAVGAGC